MRSTDPLSPKHLVAIGAISATLFLWLIPAVNAEIKRHVGPTVQTYVLAATCPRRPAQYEILVITVDQAGKRTCSLVSSRGAYGVTR